LRGFRAGLGAPEPLELVEGLVVLCHAVCVTLSEELVVAPHARWFGQR
jgi:hypothetical protein